MAGRSLAKLSRRAFIGVGIGAAAVEATVAKLKSAPQAAAPRTGITTENAAVDQNSIRRRGTGLRALDPARASAGLTLFAPTSGGGTVFLIDLRGNVVHEWKMPSTPNNYGYLTDRGTLFYNTKGGALEADWNGKVLWEIRRPELRHHHDGRLLKNGNVVLLCETELPDDVAKQVRGGRPGTERTNGRISADYLVEVTTDGRTVWEWRAWEHLDPAKDVITAIQDPRSDWTWGNAVTELPDGNLLVSFRNISTIVRIERQTGEIAWKLGAPPLSGQHAPTPLPDGHVLIFDNGPHRLDDSFPFSRVLEVNPATNEIVWKYQDTTFYSPRFGGAQRLPNSNTLINEGLGGRFFEVTTGGDVVWEYVNPYFGPATEPPKNQFNNVFRVYRYSEDEIAKARRAV